MADNDSLATSTRSDETRPSLIRQYEDIAHASHRMLEAAMQCDWEGVKEIESQCREMIVRIKQLSEQQGLGEGEERRRVELLREILRDDARMRLQAEPWLRDLEDYLSPPRRPKKRSP